MTPESVLTDWGTLSPFNIYHILMSGEDFYVSTGSMTNQLLVFNQKLTNGTKKADFD